MKRDPVPAESENCSLLMETKQCLIASHKMVSCSFQDMAYSSSTNSTLDWFTVSTRQLIFVVRPPAANAHTTKKSDSVTVATTSRKINNKTCSTINHIHRFQQLDVPIKKWAQYKTLAHMLNNWDCVHCRG
jgi:hypothetical protein